MSQIMTIQDDETSLLEKTISALRFPLLIGVVLIHCDLTAQYLLKPGDAGFSVMYLFSQVVCRICVPLYFLMSGLLFFRNTRGIFNAHTYKTKLTKRIKTLLIPYLLWNMAGFIFLAAKVHLPQFFPGLAGTELNLTSFLDSFWDFRYTEETVSDPNAPAGVPINYPLWFIRDLIIVDILSPVIYILANRLRYAFPIIMLILYIGNIWIYGIVGLEINAFTFFSIGAFLSINNINPIKYVRHLKWIPIVYLLTAITDVATVGSEYNIYIHRAGIVIGVVAVASVVSFLVQKDRIPYSKSLSNMGFFIFAFNALIASMVSSVLNDIISPESQTGIIAVYFLLLISIIAISTICYKLCQKLLPRTISILIGGR